MMMVIYRNASPVESLKDRHNAFQKRMIKRAKRDVRQDVGDGDG